MTDSLTGNAAAHRATVQEYCELSAQATLSEADADRIGDILALAEDNALLSLLIDEADHMLNHLFRCIDEADVAQQQTQLKAAIDTSWLEQVLLDASARMQPPQRKTLQSYLKDQGLYGGDIDGIVGPETQAAGKECKDLQQSTHPPAPIHLPDLQEC